MSESYPQEAGKREFRKMMKVLKEEPLESKVDTTVELESEEKSCLSGWILRRIIGSETISEPIDEVDGRTEEILRPIVKLYFLKILFIDIGITLGDLVTDIAQGLNLIFDSNWNIHWSTIHYGCIVLGFIWLPVIPMLIHIFTTKTRKYFVETESNTSLLIAVIKFVIFFPLLPSLMYMKILILRKSFTTNRERLKYLEFEQKTTELKSIAGSIESTLQFTLMLWMMSRGILTLPWDQSLSSSCVEDSLGRVACLPSIPMLSLLFSLLSILKSALDMNLVPFTNSYLNQTARTNVCGHIFFCTFPFFLVNILFRLPAYAFIMTFLDYWSIIPAVILYILQLALCGIFFIKQDASKDEEEVPMDNIMSESTGTINPISTDDEGKTDEVDGPPKELIWTGDDWMSQSTLGQGQGVKHRQPSSRNASVEKQENIEDDIKEENEQVETKVEDLITEMNTPLLINSVAGFFFPCVHTSLGHRDASETRGQTNSLQFLEKLHAWQMKVITAQVLLFNIGLIIVLITIFVLVAGVQSFNYKTNIFNFFWFSTINSYLIISGCLVILWSVRLYPQSLLPWSVSKDESEIKTNERVRRRHITGESNTASIYSATNSIISKEEKGPGKLKEKGSYCLLASFIVLLPIIILIIVYKLLPHGKIYIVQAVEDGQEITANIVGSYDSLGVQTTPFYIGPDEFILTNTSMESNDGNKMLIFMDTNPEYKWRVSSPRSQTFANGQVIMVRFMDVKNTDLNQSKMIFLTSDINGLESNIRNVLSCSNNPRIHLDQGEPFETRSKYLFHNGSVMEYFDVRLHCQDGGHPCTIHDQETEEASLLSVRVQCQDQLAGDISFYKDGEQIDPQPARLQNGQDSNYCCYNSSHTIAFYGDECDNIQFGHLDIICKFSSYFKEGPCDKLGSQTISQSCSIYGVNCILKRTYVITCRDSKSQENCQIGQYPCQPS